MSDDVMGRNAYARHRGVFPNAVTAAAKDRIRDACIFEDGRIIGIRWREADALWAKNTDPGAAEKTRGTAFPAYHARATGAGEPMSDAAAGEPKGNGANSVERVGPANVGAGGQMDISGGGQSGSAAPAETPKGDQDSYLAHRARTEEFRAKHAELDYLEALGRLVPVDQFKQAQHRRYRALRDKLLNIPDRVSTVLAAERDAMQIHHRLTEEIKRVLSELSSDARADAEAAGGASERVEH